MIPAYSTVASHVAADLLQIGACGRRLVDDSTFAHDQDAIGEREYFVEICADQEHGRAGVARAHDAGPNFSHGGEIQTKTWVGDDQEPHLTAQLTGQHGALHVASGEVADALVR